MKKITLLTAALLVACGGFVQATGNLTLTKLWVKADYAWCTSANQRDMDYSNGIIYVQDKSAKLIRTINATDGSESASINTGAAGASVSIASDGTPFMSLSFSSTHKLGVAAWVNNAQSIIMKGDAVITAKPGRIDFFAIYGNSTNGYIVAPTVDTTDAVCFWELVNSTIANPLAPLIISGKRGGFKASADAFPVSEKVFWITDSGSAPKRFTLNADNTDATVESFSTVAPSIAASGIAQFTFKNKIYAVCAENVNGSFGIYDITTGLNNAQLVGGKTENIGAKSDAGVKHCPIAVNVKEDGVEIYIYAVNNGIAAYKFEDSTPTNISAETAEAPARVFANAEGIQAEFEGEANIELFSISGAMIDKATATGYYKANVDKGIYLVKINGATYKVVK